MKPGPTYKMSSLTKMLLTTILDPVKRGEWKRAMIQAELVSSTQSKREPQNNKSSASTPNT